MSTTPRRGRPKGTGIDDSSTLAEIASLIAANPALKPTSAIKALGHTDPSVIRRLRDKFNHRFAPAAAKSADLPRVTPDASEAVSVPTASAAAKLEGATPKAARPAAVAAAKSEKNYRLKSSTKPGRKKPSVSGQTAVAADLSPGSAAKEQADDPAPAKQAASTTALPQPPVQRSLRPSRPAHDLMLSLCGMGMAAAQQALTAQMHMADQFVRNPYVALALRQQLALNEWALGLVAAPRAPVKSVS